MSKKAGVSKNESSRRSFLACFRNGHQRRVGRGQLPGHSRRSGTRAAGGKAGQPRSSPSSRDAQAAEIEAMAAQIIPTDDSPGAREAHCLYFIDRALTTFAKASQPVYIQGLQDLQAEDPATLSRRREILRAHFRAADQSAHRDREDAVLQDGPHAHRHRVLLSPGARRQLRQSRLEAHRLRRFAEPSSRRSVTTTRSPNRPSGVKEKRP